MTDLSALSIELIEKGWKLVKDVDPVLPWIGGDVEYVFFLQDGERFISGDELRERAAVLGANYGQRDAEWLVKHQEMLSECPEEVRYILFPGTLWEHPNGAFLSPYLYRTGAEVEWGVYVFWLDFGFSARVRLVRPAQEVSS